MWIIDSNLVLCLCFYVAFAATGSLTKNEQFLSVTSDNELYNLNLKLRHHSRHPDLDRLLTRVENMNKKSHNYRPNSITTTSTTTEDDFLNTYDEYDDYGENIDNLDGLSDSGNEEIDDEESSWHDDEEEEEEEINQNNEWQAEESTSVPHSRSVSSLTKYKWNNYGTRADVEKSRRQKLHLQLTKEQKELNEIAEHYMKMNGEAQCRTPLPKVVPVQHIHPNPIKVYTPHCTILHRCGEDTGCCPGNSTKCSPIKQVLIYLYFFTTEVGVDERKIEKLPFYNHTECSCMEKNNINTITVTTEASVLNFKQNIQQVENRKRCKCPSNFTPKVKYDTRCICDCLDDNQACLSQKKGYEHFGFSDRKCILNEECDFPSCEYGIYKKYIGRCTMKSEKNKHL